MTREEFYDQLCDAISTRNQDHADDLRDKIMAEYDRLVTANTQQSLALVASRNELAEARAELAQARAELNHVTYYADKRALERDRAEEALEQTRADVERLTSFSAPMAATLATLRELTASDDVVETVRELYGEVERLAAELAAARERERWIPCAERMPDAQRRVMICFMGQVSIAKYIPIVDQWSLDEGLYIHVDNRVWVDAWRELPAAPVQEVEP